MSNYVAVVNLPTRKLGDNVVWHRGSAIAGVSPLRG